MTNYLQSVLRRRQESRGVYSLGDVLNNLASFSFNGVHYTGPVSYTYGSSKVEAPGESFAAYVDQIYKSDGVVFGCMAARELLMSETVFRFRNLASKELFGTPALGLLERPWPNGTTGDLMRRMEQDGSLAGNAYYLRDRTRLRRLNPGYTAIVLASEAMPDDPEFAWDAEMVGVIYNAPKGDPKFFASSDIIHYTPVPDPNAHYRGMSWLTPVIREITSDLAATTHKQAFFEHAATPNLAVKMPDSIMDPEQFKVLREAMEESKGAANAYKTLYLAAGADVTVVGASGAIADLKQIQGHYESRICMAARVPAAIAGASEGLQGSSLNSGNFGQARRQLADGFYHPSIKEVCSVLEPLVPVPAGAQLWYDTTDIPFLREDQRDAAEIMQTQMQAIRTGIEGGYDPDAVVEAVQSLDVNKLKGNHTGLTSVQLQPPMSNQGDNSTAPTDSAPDMGDTPNV